VSRDIFMLGMATYAMTQLGGITHWIAFFIAVSWALLLWLDARA
jgi:hypothetical protein